MLVQSAFLSPRGWVILAAPADRLSTSQDKGAGPGSSKVSVFREIPDYGSGAKGVNRLALYSWVQDPDTGARLTEWTGVKRFTIQLGTDPRLQQVSPNVYFLPKYYFHWVLLSRCEVLQGTALIKATWVRVLHSHLPYEGILIEVQKISCHWVYLSRGAASQPPPLWRVT